LPSEVLKKGSTIDIWAMELAVGYESWVREKHSKGEKVVNHGKSQEELQAMIDRARQRQQEGNEVGS